jgi:hypothetical protein
MTAFDGVVPLFVKETFHWVSFISIVICCSPVRGFRALSLKVQDFEHLEIRIEDCTVVEWNISNYSLY